MPHLERSHSHELPAMCSEAPHVIHCPQRLCSQPDSFSDHSKLLHSSWPTMMSEDREDRERCRDRARARRPCLKAQRVGRSEMMSACCLFSVCLSVCLTVSLSAGSAMAGSAPCSSCSYPCPFEEGGACALSANVACHLISPPQSHRPGH